MIVFDKTIKSLIIRGFELEFLVPGLNTIKPILNLLWELFFVRFYIPFVFTFLPDPPWLRVVNIVG